MARRQTLEEMADQLYEDPEVAAAVVADADRLHNREKIIAGELTLPSPQDAEHWHNRVTGKQALTATERSQQSTIDALQERIAALESHLTTPQPPPDLAALQRIQTGNTPEKGG